ncbi:CPBP family glutamic-type intramembrane protease [Marinicellulosiphila megalodicopiae]|uniref:CPBP family glutamic-type intramembrane protease n=1 Tax=Marinicellulosiphila megalodicopiae TaxID=2724896 RepID=UPI003BAFA25B
MLNVFKSYTSLLEVIIGVWAFIKETFNLKLYVSIIFITSTFVLINEVFGLYDYIIRHYYWSPMKAVSFFAIDFSAYILCCLSVHKFTEHKAFLKERQFWLISIGIFVFIAIYRCSYLKGFVRNFQLQGDVFHYLSRLINYVDSLVVIFVPLIVFYFLYDKRYLTNFYGLRKQGVDFKPYIWMLGLMSIVIFFASAQDSFLQYYPEVKKTHYIEVAQQLGISQYATLAIYEVLYMSAFIVVEVIYRGVLIFTMFRFLGKYAVYPMICVYCLLHFGKPLNELISSFFGGFVLGVLAFKGKNIYGGIAIHMGIALLMEIFVFIRLLE